MHQLTPFIYFQYLHRAYIGARWLIERSKMAIYRDGTSKANLELIGFEYDDENSLPTRIQVKDKDGYNRWLLISDTSDIYQISYNGRFPYKGGTIEVMVGDWINLDPTFYENGEYIPEVGQHWTSVTVALPFQDVTAYVNNVEIVPTGDDASGHAYQALSKVTVSLPMQEVTVTPSTNIQVITPTGTDAQGHAYQGLSQVTVNAVDKLQLPTLSHWWEDQGGMQVDVGYKYENVAAGGALDRTRKLFLGNNTTIYRNWVSYGGEYGFYGSMQNLAEPGTNVIDSDNEWCSAGVKLSSPLIDIMDLANLSDDQKAEGVCCWINSYNSTTTADYGSIFYSGAPNYDLMITSVATFLSWAPNAGWCGTSDSDCSFAFTGLRGLKLQDGYMNSQVVAFLLKGVYSINYFETDCYLGYGALARTPNLKTVVLTYSQGLAFRYQSEPSDQALGASGVQKIVVPDALYESYRTEFTGTGFYNKFVKSSEYTRTRFVGLG